MDVNNVNNTDGRMCAQLINMLKAGTWELSGPDIMAHTETVRWVHELASKLATALRPAPASAPSSPSPPAIVMPKPKKTRLKK